MNEYYTLLIVTKKDFNIDIDVDFKVIHSDFCFIDDLHIQVNDKIYEYNYLIFTDDINYSFSNEEFFATENNKPIINFERQTSLEYIYYCRYDELKDIVIELVNS